MPRRRPLTSFQKWQFTILLVIAACLTWGLFIEPRRLVVTEQKVALPNWPTELAGLRVALLSDLHTGSPGQDLAALERLVARTNEQKPDVVILAGDYQINGVPGGTHVAIEPIAERLARLSSPLGTFAVLGNHDVWNDAPRTRSAFAKAGIQLLEDSTTRLEYRGHAFFLVGLADQITLPSRPAVAFGQVPVGAPSILVVHEPDVFADLARLGVRPSLTLAGHTHGGQVWLPLLGRRVVPSEFGERYAYGHIVENEQHLFVTSGVGTSVFPVRFLVPPEIALLTLRSAAR